MSKKDNTMLKKKIWRAVYPLHFIIGCVLSGGCFCGNQGQEKMWKWYLSDKYYVVIGFT